ncbi:hypothetical protein HDU97_008499 [Phlyctochytrium planicorne]|nr:hypothetical protein HDU97_008499 [Phlyctochytrium planicorne]
MPSGLGIHSAEGMIPSNSYGSSPSITSSRSLSSSASVEAFKHHPSSGVPSASIVNNPLASPAVKAAWDEDSSTRASIGMHGNEMAFVPPVTATNAGAARPRSTSTSQPRKHSFSSSVFPGDWIAQSRMPTIGGLVPPTMMEQKAESLLPMDNALNHGMGAMSLEAESAWARLHRSKSVDFRNSKPTFNGPSLSHAISMDEIILDNQSHFPLPTPPRDAMNRNTSPWTSPRLAPGAGPSSKTIRSPFGSPLTSPRQSNTNHPSSLSVELDGRESLALPPSIMMDPSYAPRPPPTKITITKTDSGDDTDATLNSPTTSNVANESASPTLSTISIPLSALSQSTLGSAPAAPVVIPYPTAEQIAHPDRNFSELDGLISDIVKRMLYREDNAPVTSACLRAANKPTRPASVTPQPANSKSKSARNASVVSTISSASTVVAPAPSSQPASLPPADHAHITLNVAGAVPYHPHHSYYGAPPPEPLQLSLRVVADRVETVNRLGQIKSRIEFRRVVEIPTSSVDASNVNAAYPHPQPSGHEATTFITGPVMGKDEEPSLAEEIASVLEAVAEDTGSATLSVTVRSFVDPPKNATGSSAEGEPFPKSTATAMAQTTSAGWYGGSPPCVAGKACCGDVTHDIWGYNVGPAEICPCGRHLAEGMRIFKLRKEVVAWVCSSSNGVPHHITPTHQPQQYFPQQSHAPTTHIGGFSTSAYSAAHSHNGALGGSSMMVGYGAALIGQPVMGMPFERYDEDDDAQSYIIRSAWLPDDKKKIRLNLAVMTFPLDEVWDTNVTVQMLEKAKENESSSSSMEAFEERLKLALKGGKDGQGRRTECIVRKDARKGRTLSFIVYPDLEGLIELELLAVALNEASSDKKVKLWSTCMDYLVKEVNTSKENVIQLREKEALLQRDLEEMRHDFDLWVSTYREKAETQIFRKFRDVLNEKKKKIRELKKALEFQESTRKHAEKELSDYISNNSTKIEPLEETSTPRQKRSIFDAAGLLSSESDVNLWDKQDSPTLSPIRASERSDEPPRLLLSAGKKKDESAIVSRRKRKTSAEDEVVTKLGTFEKKPKVKDESPESKIMVQKSLSLSEESLLQRLH